MTSSSTFTGSPVTMDLLAAMPIRIDLAPSTCPAAWPSGSVKGLCARGGFEVDIAWSAGKLTAATIRSRLGGKTIVRYADKDTAVDIAPGGERVLR